MRVMLGCAYLWLDELACHCGYFAYIYIYIYIYIYCSPLVPLVRSEVGHGYCHLFFVFSSPHVSFTAYSITSLQILYYGDVIHSPPTVLDLS